LIEEQKLAAGVPKSTRLHKAADAGIGPLGYDLSTLGEKAYKMLGRMSPEAQLLFLGAGLGSAGMAGVTAFNRASESDPNRALRKQVREELLKRLQGNASQGGASPMVIKIRTDRIGKTPIRPGASALVDPESGRDALSTL
jgi:hypothetical protein